MLVHIQTRFGDLAQFHVVGPVSKWSTPGFTLGTVAKVSHLRRRERGGRKNYGATNSRRKIRRKISENKISKKTIFGTISRFRSDFTIATPYFTYFVQLRWVRSTINKMVVSLADAAGYNERHHPQAKHITSNQPTNQSWAGGHLPSIIEHCKGFVRASRLPTAKTGKTVKQKKITRATSTTNAGGTFLWKEAGGEGGGGDGGWMDAHDFVFAWADRPLTRRRHICG